MNARETLIDWLKEQELSDRKEIVYQMMETFSAPEHEAIITEELEWLSPSGLDRAAEKIKDLQSDYEPTTYDSDWCDDCAYKNECNGSIPCLRLDNREDQILGDKVLKEMKLD